MISIRNTKLLLAVAALGFVAGCATSRTVPNASVSEQDLRATDRDVLFGTEFPVADKSDAMTRASAAWSAGDIDRALFFYVKALQFDPEDADLLATIGNIHRLQNEPGLAVRAFSMALRIDPNHAAALEGRGLIALSHEENEIAESDLKRAVAIDPSAWRAHNGLGILADRRGDHLIAATHYDTALELVPESAVVLNNRGYSRFLAGDYEAASKDLHAAASHDDYDSAYMNLGVLYAEQGRYVPAIDMYRKVLSEAQTYNKVAEAAMANADFEVAENLLEHAIHESPTYFPAAEENLQRVRLLKR